MAKKIAIAVWTLTAAFLGILTLNYFSNRDLISNINQGRYEQNQFGFLGFTEPYINHFNRGNVYYKLRDFEKAKQEYQMALNLNPKDPYDCKIRVNYALSYVTPIDVDKIDELSINIKLLYNFLFENIGDTDNFNKLILDIFVSEIKKQKADNYRHNLIEIILSNPKLVMCSYPFMLIILKSVVKSDIYF